MKKIKILICGSSGFMGTNLFEHFSKTADVYGVIHNHGMRVSYESQKVFTADLTTKSGIDFVFKNRKYDVVIQAAAVTSGAKDITQKPYIHVTDNVIMNSLLLQACYDYKVEHFIFLSCGVSYPPSDIPLPETALDLNKPISKPYFGVGWTKVYTEKLCEFYSGLGVKCTVIRHSNTIGPFDKYKSEQSHFFAANIRKVIDSNEPNKVQVWGEGKELRDLIYVSDVVDFIDLKINEEFWKHKFDVVNVSYGKSFSVNEIVDKIINHSGKQLSRENYISQPSIPINISMSNDYAWREYRWEPKVSIDDAIDKCIEYYKTLKNEE